MSAVVACGPGRRLVDRPWIDAGGGGGADGYVNAARGQCSRSRLVLGGDVLNARDLGGVPLEPNGSVACGTIFRGPPLVDLARDGCADVAVLGMRTILDLRTADERWAEPDDACVGAAIVDAPLPIPYDVSARDYLADFDTDASIALVFRTLADDAAYPIYIHCTYGRDRTGVVVAAILLALGASHPDVVAEYSLSTSTVGATPASLEALLNEIDARGGIDTALAAKGVSTADLEALRARVTMR